ncbi:hypothetical protein CcaCcLH18_03410 [Colletotrichum camelliae]|nr:hypothetical protein CcaCcLH18_03410 [Colletotrichum camelliae]
MGSSVHPALDVASHQSPPPHNFDENSDSFRAGARTIHCIAMSLTEAQAEKILSTWRIARLEDILGPELSPRSWSNNLRKHLCMLCRLVNLEQARILLSNEVTARLANRTRNRGIRRDHLSDVDVMRVLDKQEAQIRGRSDVYSEYSPAPAANQAMRRLDRISETPDYTRPYAPSPDLSADVSSYHPSSASSPASTSASTSASISASTSITTAPSCNPRTGPSLQWSSTALQLLARNAAAGSRSNYYDPGPSTFDDEDRRMSVGGRRWYSRPLITNTRAAITNPGLGLAPTLPSITKFTSTATLTHTRQSDQPSGDQPHGRAATKSPVSNGSKDLWQLGYTRESRGIATAWAHQDHRRPRTKHQGRGITTAKATPTNVTQDRYLGNPSHDRTATKNADHRCYYHHRFIILIILEQSPPRIPHSRPPDPPRRSESSTTPMTDDTESVTVVERHKRKRESMMADLEGDIEKLGYKVDIQRTTVKLRQHEYAQERRNMETARVKLESLLSGDGVVAQMEQFDGFLAGLDDLVTRYPAVLHAHDDHGANDMGRALASPSQPPEEADMSLQPGMLFDALKRAVRVKMGSAAHQTERLQDTRRVAERELRAAEAAVDETLATLERAKEDVSKLEDDLHFLSNEKERLSDRFGS